MNTILWIFAASIAANVLLLIWWLLARQRADHWHDVAKGWETSSDQWECKWGDITEECDKLRREIVSLATKATAPATP